MKAHFNKFIVLLGLVSAFTIGCSRQVKEDNPFAHETVIYTNRGEQINNNPTIDVSLKDGREVSILPDEWMNLKDNFSDYKNAENYRIEGVENTTPKAVDITWTSESGAQYYLIFLSLNKDMTNTQSIFRDVQNVTLKDLFAGSHYYYQIHAHYSDKTIISRRFDFKTVDFFRLINIDGVQNGRDLGNKKTIDGTKRKHDLNRVYKNSERGSYEDVVKNIPLWLKQFPNANTKVTLSSEDLPYVCESVLHLFHLGIRQVFMNCVYEDVWKSGDDAIFEKQLVKLADAIIEQELYNDYYCSVFDAHIGRPNRDNQNWCGSGKMLAIDSDGNFHPCNRFVDFSLRNKKPRLIGNVNTGIDPNKVRPFVLLDLKNQSPEKCLKCEISKGCAWCQGENYDSAETDTIYQRATAICMMHKARVRANNYYWNKLYMHIYNGGKAKSDLIKNRELC
jgi:radical SAM peptide maturase (CXXX-repeat target family)